MIVVSCPSCGAPVTINVCPYCKTLLRSATKYIPDRISRTVIPKSIPNITEKNTDQIGTIGCWLAALIYGPFLLSMLYMAGAVIAGEEDWFTKIMLIVGITVPLYLIYWIIKPKKQK